MAIAFWQENELGKQSRRIWAAYNVLCSCTLEKRIAVVICTNTRQSQTIPQEWQISTGELTVEVLAI